MRVTIPMLTVLTLLTVLAGVAGSANALDPKTFWEENDRQTQ